MKLGFIGTGKIASAVLEAICGSDLQDYEIFISPRNEQNSKTLAAKYEPVQRANSNQEVLDQADIIFVALKTDVFENILRGLSFRNDHTVVSLIPYSTISLLKALVFPATNISRATPLPTVVHHVCPVQVLNANSEVKRIFSSIGQVLEVETEKQFQAIWTLTGLISPYYDLMAALSDWAVENDVEKSIADKYIADMFHSLSLAASKSAHPDFNALSTHAATPGGLNEWAGEFIKSAGAHEAYKKAADHILKKFDDI